MKRLHSTLVVAIVAAAGCASIGFAAAASAADLISGRASDGLVFVLATGEGMDLWRARISDGALQRITATPDQDERRPIWSGSADRVAFIARNRSGFLTSNIKILNVSKGAEENLGPEPDLYQGAHVWSPDGKYLAHVYRAPASRRDYVSPSGAVVVELGKTDRVNIAGIEETRQHMVKLEYSSDGKMILANGRIKSNHNGDKLWILQLNQKPRQLTGIQNGIYEFPHFTRDDKKAVFTHQVNQSERSVMTLDLAPNSRAQRLAKYPGSDDYSAIPSPTRDEIVFISNRDGTPDLFLVDLSGGTPVNLTKGSKAAESSPIWSPDGERIAYVVIPEGAEENDLTVNKVRVMDRTGKISFETAGVMPSWMPPWTGDLPFSPGVSDALEAIKTNKDNNNADNNTDDNAGNVVDFKADDKNKTKNTIKRKNTNSIKADTNSD